MEPSIVETIVRLALEAKIAPFRKELLWKANLWKIGYVIEGAPHYRIEDYRNYLIKLWTFEELSNKSIDGRGV